MVFDRLPKIDTTLLGFLEKRGDEGEGGRG